MKNKIYKSLLVALTFIFTIQTINVFAAPTQEFNWFVKRNGHNTPEFPKNAENLTECNCIYIDNESASGIKDKTIYITFDAGYENGNVAKIADILRDEQITAAFFLLDNIILKNTDLINSLYNDGHLICNHTRNHKNLCKSSREEIEKSLKSLEDVYRDTTGREMDKFFRFPEGKYSKEAISVVSDMGYTTVFWSFAYDDWDNKRQPTRERAISKVLDNTHPGAIMLFHPTSDTNAEIFPELIAAWKSMGYSFGSLYDIINK